MTGAQSPGSHSCKHRSQLPLAAQLGPPSPRARGCAAPIPALVLPSLAAPQSQGRSCHRTATSPSFQRRGEPRGDRTRTATAPRGASPFPPRATNARGRACRQRRQDSGWAGAARQACREAREGGPGIPRALREGAPGCPHLTCSPGRARSPRRLPPPLLPVCRGLTTRCPLPAALALPLATASRLPPRPARRLARRRVRDGRSITDARVPLAGGGAGGGTPLFQWLGHLSVRGRTVIGGGGLGAGLSAAAGPAVPRP